MEQGYSVAIVGAGASGCICAYHLIKSGIDVTLFEEKTPLWTLLPTGGGRCNLTHAEYDFRELAKNYPRGEKFLYSVFSKFSVSDTISMFEDIGIKTYTQEDGRIFPVSNSSKDVRFSILKNIKSAQIVKEKVLRITQLNNGYELKTNKAEYYFSHVVISIGGGKTVEGINHNIIEFKPSLVGLNTDKKDLSGIVLKNVYSKETGLVGDVLFTHYGLSGPLVYKISSLYAFKDFPYDLHFDFYPQGFNLQEMLNRSPHKELKNILSELFPHRFSAFLSGSYAEKRGCDIDGNTRDKILNKVHSCKFTVTRANKGEETVTAGGYDLNEINSKTMESKIYPKLFFTGETLNIDGFCGGYNLQNAWSTGYIAAEGIINS